jgi:hypothetical protein
MDGLNEIQFGIVFLMWGGINIALELWGAGLPEWARWSWLAFVLVAVFLTTAITRRLRARWVHPRIGYVKWAPPIVGRPVIAMFLGGVVTLLTIVALRSSLFRSSLPVFMGLLIALCNFAWWIRLKIQRLLIYALLALASGLGVGWTLPAWLGYKAVLCLVSVFYLVGGFLALRHLMRQPLATEDQP